MMVGGVFDRGDICYLDLNPTKGREQQGHRPVLVITRKNFNKFGMALVCPITQGGNFARSAGFGVSLSGTGTDTQGLILCHQPRMVDLSQRQASFIEQAPDYIVDDVIARLQTLLD